MDIHYTKEHLDKLYNDLGHIFKNKYEFLSDEIFVLAPYDDSISEKWGKAIYEVMKAIYECKNYDYINIDQAHYETYLIVANLFEERELIEWGTSIRTAWFQTDAIEQDIKVLLDWMEEGKCINSK